MATKKSGKKHEMTATIHAETRINNPEAGHGQLEPPADPTHTYAFDPHESPALDWAGKTEGESFTVPTSSIHVHETVRPHRIIFPVQKEETRTPERQQYLFPEASYADRAKSTLAAVETYQHAKNWMNRMIAGDSLIIMNSLLQKESMAGTVQTCYIDPPYGIRYGSNFQPFVGKKDVKDRSDDDLSTEPEMIRAFRDTWELGIHSYLTYLRNRLLLVRELLCDSGSVFVQISDENVHHVRELCDEVFSPENFVTMIKFTKSGKNPSNLMGSTTDYLVWYAKDKEHVKYRQLYVERKPGTPSFDVYRYIELEDGTVRKLTPEEMNDKTFLSRCRNFQYDTLLSAGATSNSTELLEFEGKKYSPPANNHWKTTIEGMKRLIAAGRISASGKTLRYKRYMSDSPMMQLDDMWNDTGGTPDMLYVVQTSTKVIQRCILMTSDPGDLVLDITCGSGTTAFVAEQWGRRWITADTSRVAIAIARQRLLTATFPYYKLADLQAGVSAGFVYETVPHITLKSIANNEPPAQEILYDKPETDSGFIRLTGPFTVEALPAPVVFSPDEAAESGTAGEGAKLSDWREQLKATGIVSRGGERIRFSRVEAKTGTRWLNAEAETEDGRSAYVCFADESSLMDSRRVFNAVQEALLVKPDMLIFAAFQFDPEASQLIEDLAGVHSLTILQALMNTDLMTEDLRKKLKTDQSFWLVGQPDVELLNAEGGMYRVRVLGFDYYDVKAGKVDSGNADKIAMWMLDPDYDGGTLNPSQVFFPMEGRSGGWAKLARTLNAEIDAELIEAYSGTESLPFKAGEKIAVKVIDDRGIESMKVLRREEAE
ncbi:MAG: site-specific DNA-methyltransferase [Synergistaceae bacterium]|nr:site-specific DNA-methyltransferase [Synergistaceae bacterium]